MNSLSKDIATEMLRKQKIEGAKKIKAVDITGVKHMLRSQRPMNEPFHVPMNGAEFREILEDCYRSSVVQRGGTFQVEPVSGALDLISDFLTATNHKEFGVCLLGSVGNGKTTLVKALQRVINALNSLEMFSDTSTGIVIVDARDMAEYAKGNRQEFERLKRKSLLAIEDFGREAAEMLNYGNTVYPLAELIEYRYAERLFTVLTTNLTPQIIRERYGERVADRLREMVVSIPFTASSFRGK